MGVYCTVLSLECDFIAVPCPAPTPEAEVGNPWYRDQRSRNGDIRECERDKLLELHPQTGPA